jgi:hypothetical protein
MKDNVIVVDGDNQSFPWFVSFVGSVSEKKDDEYRYKYLILAYSASCGFDVVERNFDALRAMTSGCGQFSLECSQLVWRRVTKMINTSR